MADLSTEKKSGKKLLIFAGIGVGALAAILFGVFVFLGGLYDPPEIQGVQDALTVYADDDIPAALFDGVSAVGGTDRPNATFPVQVSVHGPSLDLLLTPSDSMPACSPGTYDLTYTCQLTVLDKAEAVHSTLTVLPPDTEPPVISGAQNIETSVGASISYRSGITVTDNSNETVALQIDNSQVDLTRPGQYPVTYSAADSRGNRASVTVTVTVKEAEVGEISLPASLEDVTEEDLNALADRILQEITTPDMTQYDKAKAIYDYVHGHITYVNTSDKSSWILGAYVGLTQGKGDCFNYFAASKVLLTRAGISNIDLERVGGKSDHYWQLVNVGDGYYHFDACPHPNGYPIYSFMLTEQQVREYSELCKSVRLNYYVYDYDACPVEVVGTPET